MLCNIFFVVGNLSEILGKGLLISSALIGLWKIRIIQTIMLSPLLPAYSGTLLCGWGLLLP